ncbi:MAG TPA: alpha/beta hydrolase, partial [Ktedonobacteraceae bacterium]
MTSDETSSVASPVEKVERSLNIRGIQTHIVEAGSPAAASLLYLHGTFLGNLWLEFHNTLAQSFHVFAPDIPGFGLTERPNWMRDMSDYILYFRDLLDTLGLEKTIVVGHSLGGWMALELAVWYPERVEKLVLSNAAGIRVKGSPIADLFAMNPQEVVMACFDNLAAAMLLMPAEFNTDYLLSQYRQLTTLASLAWNPTYDPTLERRLERINCPT